MTNISVIKGELYKFYKSKGYFLIFIMLALPLSSAVSIILGTKGIIGDNACLMEWIFQMNLVNVAFTVLEIMFFVIIIRYYLNEINSGYFKNIFLFNMPSKSKVRRKNLGISTVLWTLYSLYIIFLILIYYFFLLNAGSVSGKLFSNEYGIMVLIQILVGGIIYCSIYPRIVVILSRIFKKTSPFIILMLIIFLERAFQKNIIMSYILPFGMFIKYSLLSTGLNSNILINVNNIFQMIIYPIIYLIILDIICNFIEIE